jgi:two-component system sensor histidine kinase HydH
MAATVAHEVRNPLAGISANAELLAEAPLDPEDKETIDIILGEVHRLSQLVTDLLTYAREREPRFEVVDLGALAKHACELSLPEAEKFGIVLRVKGHGRAFADNDLSRQALLNVLRNAIQASPEAGTVHILVEDARLVVMDQGTGVPTQLRANLFEPFVTGRTRGMGLGAAVALRCQQRQGGYLALTATGPSGSSFEFGWQACPEW